MMSSPSWVVLEPISALPYPLRPSEAAGELESVDEDFFHLCDALKIRWDMPLTHWRLKSKRHGE